MPARFGYEARDIIKLSNLIDEDAHKVRRPKSIGLLPHDRIKHLQETGNALR
jgi:deoxycytidylate deaminase